MGRFRDDDDDDDRSRKRRRKTRKKGGAGIWIFIVSLLLVLVGGGITLVLVLSGGSPNLSRKPGELFLGQWKGTSKEHPSLSLEMEVRPERLIFTAFNKVAGEGDGNWHRWKVVREDGNRLVISQQLENNPRGVHEWTITFTSDDQMSVMSAENRTLGDYHRVSKRGGPEK